MLKLRIPRVPATETQLKAAIVSRLRALGYYVHVTSERRRGYSKMPSGLPDLYYLHPHKRVSGWIECKMPGQALRPEQEAFAYECVQSGAAFARIERLADVDEW